MSRLERQLRALERRHQPACWREHRRIVLAWPGGPPRAEPGPCPECGRPRETIEVLLAFDLHHADNITADGSGR